MKSAVPAFAFKRSAVAAALALAFPLHALAQADAAAPSNAELYEVIKSLQAEIKALRAEVEAAKKQQAAGEAPTVKALTQKVETQQAQIEALAEAAEAAPAASRVKFGGYGELHYNSLTADDPSRDVEEIDLHRFVLYTGYDFNESIRFVSELEVEHSFVEKDSGGEVELEQAYLEFDINPMLTARGGLMLIPVGIINETHEPPTFYGVERNDVENVIIPTTWWAGGAGVTFRFAPGLQWDLMVHEGLKVPTTGDNAFRVRSGRQKTSNATASDLAYTTRLRYTGIPGLELAGSLQYQSDLDQVEDASLDSGVPGLDDGVLYSAHIVWSKGPFALRALYAGWSLSGDPELEAADADEQTGWYVEPSWRIVPAIGIYTRYQDIEAARLADRFTQWEGGFNYYPHPQVVLKADYRVREHDLASQEGRDFDGFDLGIGYSF